MIKKQSMHKSARPAFTIAYAILIVVFFTVGLIGLFMHPTQDTYTKYCERISDTGLQASCKVNAVNADQQKDILATLMSVSGFGFAACIAANLMSAKMRASS